MTNSYAILGSQRDKAKRARNVIDAVDSRRQGEMVMRTVFKTAITVGLAMVVLGMSFVSRANAQCGGSEWLKHGGIQLQSFEEQLQVGTGSFLLVSSDQGSNNGIIGFWKVKFLSEGNAGIPDGTVLDNGFAQWHSDGTEIMNSSKPPVTGDFCLGVWQKNGPSSYQLNHFALGFDTSSNFIGPVQIQERVTVDRKADQYTGTFTIDQFDPMGNPLAHVAGNVAATRITVDTPVGDVL
ncbi:hypothetical protein [Candidatus Binatus sp.]|uniref:hypothetical protein n=1 Tax=Candidatus Binatus sp. TaxID=2811406 RepID=UPI003CA583A5